VAKSIFRTIIYFILLNTLVLAKIPDWATTNKHKKYPSSRYFLGVGISEEKTIAIDMARVDISSQIQVKIESEMEALEQELTQDNETSSSAEVNFKIKSTVSATVSGIEIVEIMQEKGKYYVLAVLNKEKYLSTLIGEMDGIFHKTDQLVKDARLMLKDGKIFSCIKNFTLAGEIIPEYYIKNSLLVALSGKSHSKFNQLSKSGISSEARDIMAHIEINIISGNNQEGFSGKQLPDPVQVKVEYKTDEMRAGISSFPIIAKYSNGEILTKSTTNSDGFFIFNPTATSTDNIGESGEIIVGLDLSKIPENLKTSIPKAEVAIFYKLKKLDLQFSLHITDNNGNVLPDIENKITSYITDNGFTVIDDAPFSIVGKLSVGKEKTIDSPMGNQYYIETSVQLNLIERKSGDVLSSIKARGKGLDMKSRSNAILKAQKGIKLSKKNFSAFLQKASK